MKKFFSLILVLSLCASMVLLSGCVDTSSKSSLEQIKARGTLVMYTNAAFVPFEYVNGNEVVGVDVDIARAIAEEIGVTLDVRNVEFDTIIASIKTGKGDIGAAGITVRPDREEEVDFSTKYIKSKQYIILPEDSDVETIEDLAGMKIGVQEGTTGNFVISDEIDLNNDIEGTGALEGTGAEVLLYVNAVDASMALKSGKIDAVVIDELPALNIANVNDGLKAIELVFDDGSTTEEEYAICVKKGNEELLEIINKVIEELLEDGSIEEFIIYHTNETTI